MKGENILNRNCRIIEEVCDNLVKILENLENILFHLEPLNNFEENDDYFFTNLNDKKNDIIILSNVIYNNINKVKIMLHDFINTIPPSYTYYSTFYYNDYLILKEKKKKEKKKEDEKGEINNEQDKTFGNNSSTNVRFLANSNSDNVEENKSECEENKSECEENKSECEEEFFYFSCLIDLEYSNLLYMKKYEEKIQRYLINAK
ncbi:conserved Plasmodium protein, unknown function [Plasmodium ovale wallikeri]|uniref:Uncharacterized protein n=1 Tax=Plasmodium ovale wallikeri TaxID=864142 RepID=A0A1A8YYW1_PLAOA|nr:conserved Plasmodium protein, unknown function [Plasmodium ovale wallikeri]